MAFTYLKSMLGIQGYSVSGSEPALYQLLCSNL